MIRVVFILVFFVLQGCATPMQKGVNLYQAKKYDLAADQFNPQANAGDSVAQNYLGIFWLEGLGRTPINYTEALTWFSRSAEQGNAHAMHNIGLMHERGQGVVASKELAVSWFTLAAKSGLPMSRARLAQLGAPVPPIEAQLQQANNSYSDAELVIMMGLLGSIGGSSCTSASVGSVSMAQCR